MERFLNFVKQIGKLRAAKSTAVAAVPFSDFFVHVGPGYPSRAIVASVVGVLAFIGFILGYVFLFPRSVGLIRRVLKISTILFVVMALVYGYFFVRFSVENPDHWHRAVKGFEYTPKAKIFLSVNPNTSDKELLEAAEYDPDQVWTEGSLALSRSIFFVIWALLFLTFQSIVVSFGSLALKQQQSSQRRERR